MQSLVMYRREYKYESCFESHARRARIISGEKQASKADRSSRGDGGNGLLMQLKRSIEGDENRSRRCHRRNWCIRSFADPSDFGLLGCS
jgi:hypothetical protein